MKVFLLIAVSFMLMNQPAPAAVISVATGGGDYTTITAGLAGAAAGDTVLVAAGTYNEAVTFDIGGSSTNGFITLLGQDGAVVDGTGLAGGIGITIDDVSYVRVQNLEITNFKGGDTPIGISVENGCSHIELIGNMVHHIENATKNAHGIACYGYSAIPISDLLIRGNEVRDCLLGQSEALVLNGNVDGFTVQDNLVHDNDNIGIDIIGFEGNGPAGADQARNGVIVGNHVYNCSSRSNPTYSERSAGGIYVDGGRDILIDRNTVDNCDIGIEVASEHAGKATENILIRNNFISRSFQGSINSGGWKATVGSAVNIGIINNTLYQGNDGAIFLQHNNDGIVIRNNIMYGNDYVVEDGRNNTNVVVENNLYFGGSTTSAGSFTDARAVFADPQLVDAPADMRLQSTSPAINAGVLLSDSLQGTADVDGEPRVANGVPDMGAWEYGAGTSILPGHLMASPPAFFKGTPLSSHIRLFSVTGKQEIPGSISGRGWYFAVDGVDGQAAPVPVLIIGR